MGFHLCGSLCNLQSRWLALTAKRLQKSSLFVWYLQTQKMSIAEGRNRWTRIHIGEGLCKKDNLRTRLLAHQWRWLLKQFYIIFTLHFMAFREFTICVAWTSLLTTAPSLLSFKLIHRHSVWCGRLFISGRSSLEDHSLWVELLLFAVYIAVSPKEYCYVIA